jgi:hypothetical protein
MIAPEPMETLFDLAVGTEVPSGGGASFFVKSIAAEGRDAYRVELEQRETGSALSVRVLTVATENYADRTKRGHYLVILSSGLTPQASEALRRIAELC